MSNKSASGDANVRLNGRSDWENWQVQFEALARTENVWSFVMGTARPRSMPVEPTPPEINDTASGMATRSQTASETTGPITQSPAYIRYQIQWQTYQTHLKLYMIENKSI